MIYNNLYHLGCLRIVHTDCLLHVTQALLLGDIPIFKATFDTSRASRIEQKNGVVKERYILNGWIKDKRVFLRLQYCGSYVHTGICATLRGPGPDRHPEVGGQQPNAWRQTVRTVHSTHFHHQISEYKRVTWDYGPWVPLSFHPRPFFIGVRGVAIWQITKPLPTHILPPSNHFAQP